MTTDRGAAWQDARVAAKRLEKNAEAMRCLLGATYDLPAESVLLLVDECRQALQVIAACAPLLADVRDPVMDLAAAVERASQSRPTTPCSRCGLETVAPLWLGPHAICSRCGPPVILAALAVAAAQAGLRALSECEVTL